MKAIIGKKIGMSQIFTERKATPVTIIEAGSCYVTQIKTKDKDGYNAIQIGFGKAKKINKPKSGHLKKLKIKNAMPGGRQEKLKILREFRFSSEDERAKKYQVGDEIKVDIFEVGDKVDVSGLTKGRGFSGVVKRWGFKTGPMSHGSDHHREPGSIGSMFPQRVFKGKKMPGRYGGARMTVKNLEILKIDPQANLLAVKGAIPGPRGTILEVRTEE